jgi:DNA processing protein
MIDSGGNRDMLALALANVDFLKPEERLNLFGKLSGPDDLARLDSAGLEAAIGRRPARARWAPAKAVGAALRAMEFCVKRGIGMACIENGGYPPLLREIAQPPFMVFRRGPFPDPERPCAAIVGTRNPSMAAYSKAKDVARELALKGVPVVSGLALGIDRAAHEGAMAGQGPTIAVLGCGIDAVYPKSHLGLAARILSTGGSVISEYPPGWEPLKFRFPERNRIISGLSRSVLVAQAPTGSGSLITADFALDQGRDLFVLREGMEGEDGAGTRRLAEEGAAIASGADDMIADWAVRG